MKTHAGRPFVIATELPFDFESAKLGHTCSKESPLFKPMDKILGRFTIDKVIPLSTESRIRDLLEKIKAAAKGARFPANWISPPASSGANTAHACQTMVVQVAALRAAVRGTICASRLGMVGSAKPRATPKKNMQTISTVSLVQPSV